MRGVAGRCKRLASAGGNGTGEQAGERDGPLRFLAAGQRPFAIRLA